MNKLLLFIFLLNIQSIFADECDLPSGCEDKEFPYKFCKDNKAYTKCSSNPFSEYEDNTLLKPMKSSGCFEYVASSYKFKEEVLIDEIRTEQNYEIIGYTETGHAYYGKKTSFNIYYPGTNTPILEYAIDDYILEPYDLKYPFTMISINDYMLNSKNDIIFKSDVIDSLVTVSINNWKSNCVNCDLNNSFIQNCCTKIVWTDNRDVFLDKGFLPSEVNAFTSQNYIPESMGPCTYDCSKSVIYLNQTKDFEKELVRDWSMYKQFFITGNVDHEGWFSLKATLMHEMGHIFGFGDQYDESPYPCEDDESIMSEYNHHKHDRGLSEDDKCMYMKMYCWEPPVSSVIAFSESELEINIAPNPSSEEFNIYLKVSQPQNLNFEIYDNNGNIIANLGNQFYNAGNHFLNWKGVDKDQKQVVNGNYYLRISNSAKQITKKLIISR